MTKHPAAPAPAVGTRAARPKAPAADPSHAVLRDAFFGERPSTSNEGLEVIGCVHTLIAKG